MEELGGLARVCGPRRLSCVNRDYVRPRGVRRAGLADRLLVEDLPNELCRSSCRSHLRDDIRAVLTQAGLASIGRRRQYGDLGEQLHFAERTIRRYRPGAWWWFIRPDSRGVLGAGLEMINFGLDEVLSRDLRGCSGKKRGRS